MAGKSKANKKTEYKNAMAPPPPKRTKPKKATPKKKNKRPGSVSKTMVAGNKKNPEKRYA